MKSDTAHAANSHTVPKRRNHENPPRPARIATDTVVRLGREDDRAILRSMGTNYMMRFDDALDAEKLRLSLERLLDRRDWRKLWARLRLNVRRD